MRTLLDDVVMWSWLSPPHGYHFNGYFIRWPEGNLVIDPAEMDEGVLDFLAREGVATVVVTNRNHVRRAPAVRERTGARIAVHEADAAHAREQGATVDAALVPGGRIGPFTIVAASGKSPGEVALHWPARRLLVVGDAVIGNPAGRLSLLRERVLDDPPRLRASVRALTALDPDLLLVGDGEPILHDAGARLRELVATLPS